MNDNNSKELSLINKDTVIEGKITANQNVRIDGELKGEIESKNKVIIGKDGIVNANVKVKEAIIYGELDGKVEVEETIYVDENAKVNADIEASNIVIESGAKINGKLNIKPKQE